MPPLIPIETLSFYLTKTGFSKFKQWFYNYSMLCNMTDKTDGTDGTDTSNDNTL